MLSDKGRVTEKKNSITMDSGNELCIENEVGRGEDWQQNYLEIQGELQG